MKTYPVIFSLFVTFLAPAQPFSHDKPQLSLGAQVLLTSQGQILLNSKTGEMLRARCNKGGVHKRAFETGTESARQLKNPTLYQNYTLEGPFEVLCVSAEFEFLAANGTPVWTSVPINIVSNFAELSEVQPRSFPLHTTNGRIIELAGEKYFVEDFEVERSAIGVYYATPDEKVHSLTPELFHKIQRAFEISGVYYR